MMYSRFSKLFRRNLIFHQHERLVLAHDDETAKRLDLTVKEFGMETASLRFRSRKNSFSTQIRLSFVLLLTLYRTAPAQVEYRGGPTIQGPITVFLIFWEPTTPTSLFYDTTTSTSDANYRTVI